MNDQTPSDQTPGDTPVPPDPWKSFRGVMAGTLILEAIVVLLALPVVGVSSTGLTWTSGGFVIGLAVVLILMAGLQGRPWAIWANLGMEKLALDVAEQAACEVGGLDG